VVHPSWTELALSHIESPGQDARIHEAMPRAVSHICPLLVISFTYSIR
jgi:hypothetical protein